MKTIILQDFGTDFRTNKIFVPMNINFKKHSYKRNDGKHKLSLTISSEGKTHIEPLDGILIDPKKWDLKKKRLRVETKEDADINLYLDNIVSKITKIRTLYRLSNRVLTIPKLLDELRNESPRIDFIVFMRHAIKIQKSALAKGTYNRHISVLNKLIKWKTEILFLDIDQDFYFKFIDYCKSQKNAITTINSNLEVIKKYLLLAKEHGIYFDLNPRNVKIGCTHGDRTEMEIEHLIKCQKYFDSDFITTQERYALGLFLFSTQTGIRYSDCRKENGDSIKNNVFHLKASKTQKLLRIPLSNYARYLATQIDWNYKISDDKFRKHLRSAFKTAKVNRKYTFHNARHTYATNLYRETRDIRYVKTMLQHSSYREVEIYVHYVEQEEDIRVFKGPAFNRAF